jgi:GMP synthase (glutamine-hydrolysing)
MLKPLQQPILIVTHQAISNPGLVGQLLLQQGYSLDIRCPAIGHTLPETLHNHRAVIVLGGPMSSNDEDLPFIRAELDWTPTALGSGKPFLGICLGAQILARALGASVAPHPQERAEIGYYPIQSWDTLRSLDYVFHWHFEGFELPRGTECLATSATFPNQAFRLSSSIYGLQFHPEITTSMILDWTLRGAHLLEHRDAQSRELQLRNHQRHSHQVQQWLQDFLEHWLATPALAQCA